MSNHHSQRSINLHHGQVNAGRARRQQRRDARMLDYLIRWGEARRDQLCVVVFSVFWFSYAMIASAVYLGYVL